MPESFAPPRAAPPSRRLLLALAAGGALAAGLPACALPTRLAAVPRGRAGAATVLGLPNERFFPTEAAGQAGLQREFVAAVERQLVSRGLPPTAPPPELDLLGISGGGENGAFGAGLLNGWTERGDRPAFFPVTGISTGALSAPSAFLGSARDAQGLRRADRQPARLRLHAADPARRPGAVLPAGAVARGSVPPGKPVSRCPASNAYRAGQASRASTSRRRSSRRLRSPSDTVLPASR
jgi:hypothetical protein